MLQHVRLPAGGPGSFRAPADGAANAARMAAASGSAHRPGGSAVAAAGCAVAAGWRRVGGCAAAHAGQCKGSGEQGSGKAVGCWRHIRETACEPRWFHRCAVLHGQGPRRPFSFAYPATMIMSALGNAAVPAAPAGGEASPSRGCRRATSSGSPAINSSGQKTVPRVRNR